MKIYWFNGWICYIPSFKGFPKPCFWEVLSDASGLWRFFKSFLKLSCAPWRRFTCSHHHGHISTSHCTPKCSHYWHGKWTTPLKLSYAPAKLYMFIWKMIVLFCRPWFWNTFQSFWEWQLNVFNLSKRIDRYINLILKDPRLNNYFWQHLKTNLNILINWKGPQYFIPMSFTCSWLIRIATYETFTWLHIHVSGKFERIWETIWFIPPVKCSLLSLISISQ